MVFEPKQANLKGRARRGYRAAVTVAAVGPAHFNLTLLRRSLSSIGNRRYRYGAAAASLKKTRLLRHRSCLPETPGRYGTAVAAAMAAMSYSRRLAQRRPRFVPM